MNKQKIVMFDFDGVLVNTLDFAYEIHKEVNESFTYKQFQDFSNGNFFEGMGKAIEEGKHNLPDDFWLHYEKNITKMNIHDILDKSVIELSKTYKLTVVSSTRTDMIDSFLEKENIKKYFTDILGADIHKSKVTKIKMLLDKYSISPKDAVFITDTLGDILEANECGVPSIAVTWGLHEKYTLEKGNPAKIIENPLYLVDAVKEILG